MCVFILFVVSTLKLMLAPNMGGVIHVPQLVFLLFWLIWWCKVVCLRLMEISRHRNNAGFQLFKKLLCKYFMIFLKKQIMQIHQFYCGLELLILTRSPPECPSSSWRSTSTFRKSRHQPTETWPHLENLSGLRVVMSLQPLQSNSWQVDQLTDR